MKMVMSVEQKGKEVLDRHTTIRGYMGWNKTSMKGGEIDEK